MKIASLRQEESGIVGLLLLLLILLILGCWLAPGSTLAPYGRWLVVNQEPADADATVVLLGGGAPDRVIKAKELLDGGFGKRIAFGTGYVDEARNYKPELKVEWPRASRAYEIAFDSVGIGSDKRVLIDTSGGFDTSGELQRVADYARKNDWKKVNLVSSALHTRRVYYVWNRVAPDIEGRVIAAPDPLLSEWWKHGYAVRAVGYETGALIKEGFRRFALNVAAMLRLSNPNNRVAAK
jgi:uncharacterized SAM-binding protein YcdF (DUF218 family)